MQTGGVSRNNTRFALNNNINLLDKIKQLRNYKNKNIYSNIWLFGGPE